MQPKKKIDTDINEETGEIKKEKKGFLLLLLLDFFFPLPAAGCFMSECHCAIDGFFEVGSFWLRRRRGRLRGGGGGLEEHREKKRVAGNIIFFAVFFSHLSLHRAKKKRVFGQFSVSPWVCGPEAGD